MYTLLPALSEEKIAELLAVRGELELVEAKGHRLRVGKNILERESVYSYSRWFSWNRHQRKRVKDVIPQNIISRALQFWFLEFPERLGFLDTMTQWVGKPQCGTVIAYALRDGQYINLEGNTIFVERGAGIAFHLSTVHQVDPTRLGGLWACTMIRACHTTCKQET